MLFKYFELFFMQLSLRDSQLFFITLLSKLELVDSFSVLFSQIADLDLTHVNMLQFNHQILVLMLTLCQIHVYISYHIDLASVSSVL